MKKDKKKSVYIIIIIVFFLVIILQLFSHQILNGVMYSEISRKNYVRIIRVNARRGDIFDEKLRPIVTNQPSINLYFKPHLITNKSKTIDFLVANVGITDDYIEKLIYDNRFRSFEDVLIYKNLQEDMLVSIAENMNYYPELILKAESIRYYSIPNHFTGYVGKINDVEYQRYKTEDYTLNSIIGKNGIERYYEALLAGKSGYEILQVDSKGKSLNLFTKETNKSPINGINIVLTINLELQEFIRSIFPSDKAGAVVVMNPRTGGVLSYNSFPEYDQNWFAQGITEEQWDFLISNVNKPQIDRVTTGTYPPGSTFKILSAAFGLEKNYIVESTKLASCTGGMQVGNRFFRCWDKHGHGRTNVYDAIARSCDVFFYDLSGRFRLDDFSMFGHTSHLFSKTGIDLPTERNGLFPNTEYYRRTLGQYFSPRGIITNLVIGQGEVLVSPLAMCSFYSAIANDGVWNTPHFYLRALSDEKIISPDDENRYLNIKSEKLPFKDSTLQIIQNAIYGAVNKEYGTARGARVHGVEVYGKTGSSENHQGDLTHASFAGYAKWNNIPELAIYVIVENAGGGSAVAVPVARQIIQFYNGIRLKP